MSEWRDPIERWRDVSARAARATGYRPGVRARVQPLAGWSIGGVAVAVAVVIGALVLRPAPDSTPGSSSPPGASAGPVVATTDDGMFRLTLTTPRSTYSPDDAIEPVATITYLGPDAAVTAYHAAEAIGFRIEEVDGKRIMGGGMDQPCLSTPLTRDVPSHVLFSKAGVPDDTFDRSWYEDPVLRLPIGTWRIVAVMSINVGNCGKELHEQSVENIIRVVASGPAEPSMIAQPTPSPSLSPDAAIAIEFVRKFEDGLATGHAEDSWRFLSPWSRLVAGSAATFMDAERRALLILPDALEIDRPILAADLPDPAILNDRAEDLAAVAVPARTFVVGVRHRGVDGSASATQNLVVAPMSGDWRIWLDAVPGSYGSWSYPSGCPAFGLSGRRCTAIVDEAASQAGIDPANATAISLMAEPGCGGDPLSNEITLCTRSQSFVAGVRFDLDGAEPVRIDMFCGVGMQNLICSETPGINAIDLHNAGYWDVPCAGEPPDGCPSPMPVLSGAAARSGTELRIDSIAIPIGPVGRREVDLGRAVLVNGLVQEARFALAGQTQTGFLLSDGSVQMELRSTVSGRPPFDNIYRRGTFDGLEEVRVVLVFDVVEADPDAAITVTDVLVR